MSRFSSFCNGFSLKYRIAAIIFLLEAIMMVAVLGVTLSYSLENSQKQLISNEKVLLTLLGDLSRIALFTAEYDELQPYIEQVVAEPHVVRVLLANRKGRVVVSSDVRDVGTPMPELSNTQARLWRTQEITNANGLLGTVAINFSHEQLLQTNDEAWNLGGQIALGGMSFIAIVGIVIGHLLTRRLGRLTTAAQRFAQGDLQVKTGLKGRDEVAIVGQAFDHMANSLDEYIRDLKAKKTELKKAHDDLERRVEERTAELAVARDEAVRANRTKSAFLANMSHELRTPLNAIIGYAELVREELEDKNETEFLADLDKITGAGNHLLNLINQVLDLSKVESGKMELCLEDFDVPAMLQEVITTAQPLVEKNHNRLDVHCDNDLPRMHADVIKLRQTLLNLLSNAAKFTEHGHISLSVQASRRGGDDTVDFTVTDTGIGMDQDQMARLFEEFTQADASTHRRYGGTGLGMAISKRFCEMMGGQIRADSEPGRGTRFVITLPARVRKAA